MCRILNFGSLNIDYTYQVPAFVRPGETLSALSMQTHVGGKGLNQSIALARAGAAVYHAGKISQDGLFLRDYLQENHVDTTYLSSSAEHTGSAVIEVDPHGENRILLFGGGNREITVAQIQSVLDHFEKGDILLLQNEISCGEDALRMAAQKGMRVFINPAPMDQVSMQFPYELTECVCVNEVEAMQLSHTDTVEQAIEILCERYPHTLLIFTLGADGALCCRDHQQWRSAACNANVVDTTAAGDTFTGYFLSEYAVHGDIAAAMDTASKAAAITVSRAGAAPSIPTKAEVSQAF